jgi:hypothetical protein
MSEHQDNSYSSSGARHVSFSELVHVIACEDENGYEDLPTIMEIFNESDSVSDNKYYESNEAPSTRTEDLDLGEGLQSLPNLSYDDGSRSVETININLGSYRNKQPESDGWGSRLFASVWWISFIASCARSLGCLSSCFCSGQGDAVDYDDAVGGAAFALNADKSVVFTSFTGDGGATYVTYVFASLLLFDLKLSFFLRHN